MNRRAKFLIHARKVYNAYMLQQYLLFQSELKKHPRITGTRMISTRNIKYCGTKMNLVKDFERLKKVFFLILILIIYRIK